MRGRTPLRHASGTTTWESLVHTCKVKMLVTQSCVTLCDPMGCSLLGSSVHGILQARILEWVAISFSRGSSWPRTQTRVSCIAGRFFTIWTTREAVHPLLSNKFHPCCEPGVRAGPCSGSQCFLLQVQLLMVWASIQLAFSSHLLVLLFSKRYLAT